MIELKPQEWEDLMVKYEKLIHKIAHGIFGDVTTQHDDSYQDLCVSALEAVNGYAKKTGKLDYQSFKDDELFNKYLKTVLWNRLNTKRRLVTRALDINGKAIRINILNEEESFDIEDTSLDDSVFKESAEYLSSFIEEERKVINVISNDPLAFLQNGNINIDRIRRKLNMSTNKTHQLVTQIAHKIKNDL